MNSPLSIQQRLGILSVNLLAGYILFITTTGYLLPKGGLDSVWFLSAVSLWFLTLLSAPWFVPPRDSLISGVGATLILLSMTFDPRAELASFWTVLRWCAVGYCIVVIGLSAATIALTSERRNFTSKTFYKITSIFGTGEVLFSLPALIGIFSFHSNRDVVLFAVSAFWIFFVLGRGIEKLFRALLLLIQRDESAAKFSEIGRIYRIDHPGIVRVRLKESARWPHGKVYAAKVSHDACVECIALFSQTLGSEIIGTGLIAAKIDADANMESGLITEFGEVRSAQEIIDEIAGEPGCSIAGFVVEKSEIATIRFEVSDSTIRQGDVLFALVEGTKVYFQIVDAETSEESFDANPQGKQVAIATQLGAFDQEIGFTKFSWLPQMNTPLFRKTLEEKRMTPESSESGFILGSVPSTDLPVKGIIDHMIDHHTAILGATGTGKTEVALDVVREALTSNSKVFCVDFTGEYKHRLSDQNPIFVGPTPDEGKQLEQSLFDVETGKFGAPEEKKALEHWLQTLREGTNRQIGEFLKSDEHKLAIFELAEITNNQASLRLTEMYLSSMMNWARKNRKLKKILIVLEEAHTIVPETGGSGFDFSTQWVVGRIGQIALQGRKYGVGLLVITQRTALVSKTILSQCNTFLTHCLIDQTSLGFLTNVYGPDHCRLIPSLGKYEFLAYGKGLTAERPIMLKREYDPAKKAASDALNKSHTKETQAMAEHVVDEVESLLGRTETSD